MKILIYILKKAKLVLVENFTKQKLNEISLFFNGKQFCKKNNYYDIYNINHTKNNIKDKTIWFQIKSINKTESNLKNGPKLDKKLSLDNILPKIKKIIRIKNLIKKSF